MVPWLGFRQVIERLLREDRVEVTQVGGNVFLIVRWLRVPLEGFCKALGDGGRGADILRFREKAGFPNLITLLEVLIGEVISLRVRLRLHFLFVLVNVLHEGWEWACLTGINPAGILLLCTTLFLKLSPTASAASG
jgi:hypothetical protein